MKNGTLTIDVGEVLSRIMKNYNIKKDILGEEIVPGLLVFQADKKMLIKRDDLQPLCDGLNNFFKKEDIGLMVEVEDLNNPIRFNAKEKANSYIEYLKKLRQDKNPQINLDDIDDLEYLLIEFELINEKIRAYEVIADIYYNANNFDKEYEYILRAWELSSKSSYNGSKYKIMIKLANNLLSAERYHDAIRLYQNALLVIGEIPPGYLGHLYYNYALAHYRMEEYNLSLKIIEDLLKIGDINDYDLWTKARTLEGACFFELRDYEMALKSYSKAIQDSSFGNRKDNKYVIYGNMAEVYIKLGDRKLVKAYLDIILKDLDQVKRNEQIYFIVCNQIAIAYEYLECHRKAEDYYKESLRNVKNNNRPEYISKNLIALMELGETIEIRDLFPLLEEYINEILLDLRAKESMQLVFRSIKAYISNGKQEGLQVLLDNILLNIKEGKVYENEEKVNRSIYSNPFTA